MYEYKDPRLFVLVDWLGDLSSFLLVFVGAILAHAGGHEKWSRRLQIWAMGLLISIVIPEKFYVEWGSGPPTYFVVSTVLDCLAFIALAIGANAVLTPAPDHTESVAPPWLFITIPHRRCRGDYSQSHSHIRDPLSNPEATAIDLFQAVLLSRQDPADRARLSRGLVARASP